MQLTRALAGEGADVGTVVCGVASAWIERTDDAFHAEAGPYYARLTTTPDLLAVDDEVLKIAVHDFGDPKLVTAPALTAFCAPRQVVVSGHHWSDVMEEGVHKGLAVRDLQQALGVSAAQTMAFGNFLTTSRCSGRRSTRGRSPTRTRASSKQRATSPPPTPTTVC